MDGWIGRTDDIGYLSNIALCVTSRGKTAHNYRHLQE